MSTPGIEGLRAYLARRSIEGVPLPALVEPLVQSADEQRYRLNLGDGAALAIVYAPTALDRARRAAAGQGLGGEMGLAALLLAFDESAPEVGGSSVFVARMPSGVILGDRELMDDEVSGWLFLLLTLHHLSPALVSVTSSMSQDAATWWQRSQTAWAACQAAYATPVYQPLIAELKRLHAIVGVRIQTHADLWQNVSRRPCHGNPVPAHLAKEGAKLSFIEWDAFGLGDPAIEVGRVAALAALSGELTGDQYIRFMADYLEGMRDINDATLEERMRVFASVLPLGFCFTVLDLLAHATVTPKEREENLEQVARALLWVQATMGVEVGDPTGLLAPLRVSTGQTA